ncbi:MAG TPA: helix-turn-helix transcriptional regulator [Stellaceae bacterium]|nr:helix-turn-helix transcriptional regulator [Stellaceae bacterium]
MRSSADRRTTAALFRQRLEDVIAREHPTPSAFARAAEIDRSTLAQLLEETNDRLPRVETLMQIAQTAHVSIDWLVGISQREKMGADIIEEVFQIERHAQSPVDDRFMQWYQEAAGYRIRTIPRSFPDMLKLEDVIQFEYAETRGALATQTLETAQARLAYLRRPETEVEACCTTQVLYGFARGEGVWEGLPAEIRRRQIEHLASLCDELYPRFRLFLYDARQTYSVPLTIFGPLRAILYLGQMYLVFNAREHIQVLSRRFDDVLRAAVVQPPDVPSFAAELLPLVR